MEAVLALRPALFWLLVQEAMRARVERLLDLLAVQYAKEPRKLYDEYRRVHERLAPAVSRKQPGSLFGNFSLGDAAQLPQGAVQTVALARYMAEVEALVRQDLELTRIEQEEGQAALVRAIRAIRRT